MPINVSVGSKIVFVGDSITFQGWFGDSASLVGGTGLLVNQLSQPLVAKRGGTLAAGALRATVSVGSNPGAVSVVTGGGQINAINSGVSQNKVADIEGAIAARITDYAPIGVVLEIGVNDCRGLNAGSPTPLVTFRASYDNILATVKATLPTVSIVCLSIFVVQEHWTASGGIHFTGNPYDTGSTTPSIEQYNTEIQASALAHGCTYVDIRTPAALAESIQNTPSPGAIDGILTGAADGIHPSPAGQLVMSNAVIGQFQFV